jgi:hypothetical protein
MKINIGDTWKEVIGIKINIGDVWKEVSDMSINIGDVWKDACIMVNVSGSLAGQSATVTGVLWTVTLSSPALASLQFALVVTNAGNTGNDTTTCMINISSGATSGASGFNYNRKAGSNFTAYGLAPESLPAQYVIGTKGSYLIPMQ